MNITVTIGVTPQLEKALQGLSALAGAIQAQSAPTQEQSAPQAPAQSPVQQQQPSQQQAAVPTAAPAPVQQEQPAAQPQSQQQQPVPTSTPEYDMNQLAVASTQLVDSGKRDVVVELLNSFGVQALTQLPKEQYGAFATKLREKGAKI